MELTCPVEKLTCLLVKRVRPLTEVVNKPFDLEKICEIFICLLLTVTGGLKCLLSRMLQRFS
jgi:hypothetical protein